MNSWAAHKDQLLARKVHSPNPQILHPQYTTAMVSMCCTDNNQLKAAAEESVKGATAMVAVTATGRTIN